MKTGSFAGLLAALLLPGTAPAQHEAGHGRFTLSYQHISVDGFDSSIGRLDIGTTDAHSLTLTAEYAFTPRLAVTASLPFIRKRYRGPAAHNPASIDPQVDARFIDDGDYHSDWQDLHLGVHYTVQRDGPWAIEPYLGVGVPTNDYPFFAHAAVGQNLWRVELGSRFTYRPPLDDWFVSVTPGYAFVEKTMGVDISHFRLDAELGYVFSDRLSARLLVLAKKGGGLVFPDDFPPPRNTFYWYQHDRMVKHNWANVGVAVDWAVSPRYVLSGSLLRMVWQEQVHVMDHTVNLAVSRFF